MPERNRAETSEQVGSFAAELDRAVERLPPMGGGPDDRR